MKNQTCPICHTLVTESERYPHYVCEDCVSKAVNTEGMPVKFFNADISGGLVSVVLQDKTEIKSHDHICFINDIKCYADEAKFGGIVVIPYKI